MGQGEWAAVKQSIEDVFGVSPYVLHDRWRRYVLKNYK